MNPMSATTVNVGSGVTERYLLLVDRTQNGLSVPLLPSTWTTPPPCGVIGEYREGLIGDKTMFATIPKRIRYLTPHAPCLFEGTGSTQEAEDLQGEGSIR
jgi:hypothetical protein